MSSPSTSLRSSRTTGDRERRQVSFDLTSISSVSSSTTATTRNSSSSGSSSFLRKRSKKRNSTDPSLQPLVQVTARRTGEKCPFDTPETIQFAVYPGGCVCLQGKSGIGKTTMAMGMAGLSTVHRDLDLDLSVEWNSSLSPRERCGVLLQESTLLDELTVAGNLKLAIEASGKVFTRQAAVDLLDMVALDYDQHAGKYPLELSGGMARRASLAVQLALQKHVLVLDEPFAGLDPDVAGALARQLVQLRTQHQIALVLISHKPDLVAAVVDPRHTHHNVLISLQEKEDEVIDSTFNEEPSIFGTSLWHRCVVQTTDATLWTLPLIVGAFCTCGGALAILTAHVLDNLDVGQSVWELIDQHLPRLMQMATGRPPSALMKFGLRQYLQNALNTTVLPSTKAHLYAWGLTKLIVVELAPLLTGLLLCGRLAGSHAGKVATLEATRQGVLLRTLGWSTTWWTLGPALVGVVVAAPILTGVGSAVAVLLARWIGPTLYALGTPSDFWNHVQSAMFPAMNIPGISKLSTLLRHGDENGFLSSTDLVEAFVALDVSHMSFMELSIEILSHPCVCALLKSWLYGIFMIGTSHWCASTSDNRRLTPRQVPTIITKAVVTSSLVVLILDGLYSQILCRRNHDHAPSHTQK